MYVVGFTVRLLCGHFCGKVTNAKFPKYSKPVLECLYDNVSFCREPSVTPASLTLASTILATCDWMRASCTSGTISLSSRVSNLLSFAAKQPHCLQHPAPWSLDIGSTQCSPVHRVGMHGISNRDIRLYSPRNNSSVQMSVGNKSSTVWDDHRWNAA